MRKLALSAATFFAAATTLWIGSVYLNARNIEMAIPKAKTISVAPILFMRLRFMISETSSELTWRWM